MLPNKQMDEAISCTSGQPLADVRLLVVEDNEDNQKLIYHFLAPVGASIQAAFNGLEGLNLATSHDFDLILMDIQMPMMDGIEATRQIRTRGIATPIVAYTAFTSDECRVSCMNAGCNAFLGKPGSRNTLVNIIQSCLSLDDKIQTHRPEKKSDRINGASAKDVAIRHRSIYHDDPIVGPLLGGFIDRIPNRIVALRSALMSRNFNEAMFLAHQLKGTMLGYGFIIDGKMLADIEQKIRSNESCEGQESILPSLRDLESIYRV